MRSLAQPRLLALAALVGGVVLAGCPAPGGVGATPSPASSKKASPKASKSPKASASATATPKGGSPSPSPTATAKPGSPSPSPTPSGTPTPAGTPTPTPTPSATATPAGADPAAVTAATAFPFKSVGQTWTYDTKMITALATLNGSRVLSVKALSATAATIHIKDTTDTSAIPGGGGAPKVAEVDVEVPLAAPDPYFVIEAGIAKLGAAVTAGASTFTSKTEKVLTVDTTVIVRAYDIPAPANLKITNSLTASQGLVSSSLKGTELPADLVPPPLNKTPYTITQTLKSFAASPP